MQMIELKCTYMDDIKIQNLDERVDGDWSKL